VKAKKETMKKAPATKKVSKKAASEANAQLPVAVPDVKSFA
jgi:hypothetical protein